MVEGLELHELRSRLEMGYKLSEFVLGDWEGEMLAYHKDWHFGTISHYKGRAVPLG